MPDLDRLIKFAAVAEELSFSRAARRLNVDQPWLSRQVQNLEAQIGVALFLRSTRKVELTQYGERLYARARALVESSTKVRAAARELGSRHDTTIRFGVNPYSFWIPARGELLRRFQSRYRRAHVEVVSNYSSRLISKLRRRLVDVLLVSASLLDDEFERITLYRTRQSLLVPPEDPLAARGVMDLADMAGRRIAVTDPRLNPETHAENYGFALEAGAIPRIVAEGAHALNWYAASERLTLVCQDWPHSAPTAPDGFVHVEIEGPLKPHEYVLAMRRETSRMVLNQFWKVAVEVAEESGPLRSAA